VVRVRPDRVGVAPALVAQIRQEAGRSLGERPGPLRPAAAADPRHGQPAAFARGLCKAFFGDIIDGRVMNDTMARGLFGGPFPNTEHRPQEIPTATTLG
jgi:hypothetical protein